MQLIVKGRVLASHSIAVSTVPAISAALGIIALLGASSPASAGCQVLSHSTGVHSATVSTGVQAGVHTTSATATSLPSCGVTHTAPSMHVSASGGAVAMIPRLHAPVGRSEHTAQTITPANSVNSQSHAGLANKTHDKHKT